MNQVAKNHHPLRFDSWQVALMFVGLLTLSALAAWLVGSQAKEEDLASQIMVIGMTFVSALITFTTLFIKSEHWFKEQVTASALLSLLTIVAPSILTAFKSNERLTGAALAFLIIATLGLGAWYATVRFKRQSCETSAAENQALNSASQQPNTSDQQQEPTAPR